jgi:hypothetical protein
MVSNMPSKFSKPKPSAAAAGPVPPTEEAIERIIGRASAHDVAPAPPPVEPLTPAEPPKPIRFTLELPPDLVAEIDATRKRSGNPARVAWIRMAIAEKLARDVG